MQIFISLLTIVMSGVAATAVTYLLNARKEQVFYMRKKAEDLYLATESYDKNLTGYFIGAYPLLKGEIDYNTYFDAILKGSTDDASTKHNNVLMLLRIYFPEIEPEFDAWMSAREQLNKIITKHKRAYKSGTSHSDEFLGQYDKAMVAFDKASNGFKAAVVRSARHLTRPDALWPTALTWQHWSSVARDFRRK